MKTCRSCLHPKDESNFSADGRGRTRNICKECDLALRRRNRGEKTVVTSHPGRDADETPEVPTKLPARENKTIVAVGDTHFPFASEKGIARTLEIIAELQPAYVVQMGDLLDLYAYSKFPHRVTDPVWEIEAGRTDAEDFWRRARQLSPNSTCYQLRGNHDDRPFKRLLEKAPEMAQFVGASLRDLYTFEGVTTIHDPKQELELNGIFFMHGYRSRIGEHARWNLRNTVCGHLHRGGLVTVHDVWELNAGWLGDRHADVFDYKMQKRMDGTTLGLGIIDSLGPRFVPIG